MKTLRLKVLESKILNPVYNFYYFDKRFNNRIDFEDFLYFNLDNYNYKETDEYIEYIYNIVDNTDGLLIDCLDKKELELYKSNLKYVYYDKIICDKDSTYYSNINYLFYINDIKSKQFLKDNIKFNISLEREPVTVKTDRNYILNKDYFNSQLNYIFLKENNIQLILSQCDGYIYDYRDIDELYFLKRKNLEIENKNYNTYDYKLFSNDINDDKYINYIYDIIDNVNYIFINRLPYNEECSYKDKLNYTYYDKILLEDKSKEFNTNYIFNIKDNKSKEFIKNNIRFNLSDKDRNPIIVDTDKKYILNEIGKEEYEYIDYGFIKDDTLVAVLHQKDGFIDDYRDINIRKKIK